MDQIKKKTRILSTILRIVKILTLEPASDHVVQEMLYRKNSREGRLVHMRDSPTFQETKSTKSK